MLSYFVYIAMLYRSPSIIVSFLNHPHFQTLLLIPSSIKFCLNCIPLFSPISLNLHYNLSAPITICHGDITLIVYTRNNFFSFSFFPLLLAGIIEYIPFVKASTPACAHSHACFRILCG